MTRSNKRKDMSTSLPDDNTKKEAAISASTALKRAMGQYRRRGGGDPLDGWKEWVDPGRASEFATVLQQVHVPSSTRWLTEGNPLSSPVRDDDDYDYYYYKGPVYALMDKPGIFICPQALSTDLQTALAYAALTEYCQPPHATNIDAVPPKPREQVNAAHETFWYVWKEQQQQSLPQHQHDKAPMYKSFKKLSWATLGYQYDWTKREYHAEAYSPVPPVLQRLGTFFARTAQLLLMRSKCTKDTSDGNSKSSSNNKDIDSDNQQLVNDDTCHDDEPTPVPTFTTSACIVNYYHAKSVMGPHQDDLEYDMTKPIVSLSLGGRPCLFVVGGTGDVDDNDDAAGRIVPIILRPGDVVLMGGPHRLAYHAMTRILPLTLPAEPILPPTTQPVTLDDFHDDERDKNNLPPASDLPALQAFLQNHRININLRQVYPDGMDPREGRKGHSAEMKVGAD